MARENQLDLLVEDVGEWIESMADELVGSLTEGGATPFAADVSEADKLAYYTAQMFNRDGSPNISGRSQVMLRLGPEGYQQVMQTVLAHAQRLQGVKPPAALRGFPPVAQAEAQYSAMNPPNGGASNG